MPISDFFTTRDHVKEDVELRLKFNQSSGQISGGSVHPEFCDSEGENVLRHPVLPLSVFTVTANQRTQLETFLDTIFTELRMDRGIDIYVPPPPE